VVWLVGALLLLWVAWGPWVPVAAVAALCVPRLRWWVQDRLHDLFPVPRKVAGWTLGAVAALVVAVLVIPDSWLPVPPAPGVWAAPSYVGRPATARPVAADVPQHPHLAAYSSTRPGPLGLQPEVDTAWLGRERCGRLELTASETLVALCADGGSPRLRLVAPDSMRVIDTFELPERSDRAGCDRETFVLDAESRALVATADRRVLAVRTFVDGGPTLAADQEWDLKPYVPYGDCLVALTPDWSGTLWWASAKGLVGTVAGSGEARVVDLGEDVRLDLAADDSGAVHVVTDASLQRLVAGPDGTPQVTWRTELEHDSGSPAVPVGGGAVAVTASAKDRVSVVFLDRATGAEVCRQRVFDDVDAASHTRLASLGTGVVVTNNDGYSSPRSTLLGLTSTPGVARVDLAGGQCALRWTTDVSAPASGAAASWPNGVVYAWTKRPSLAGVSAWYLTAIDADTGRAMWGVRAGTGLQFGSGGSELAIGPDGSAWMGTLAGLVRVADRSMG
jgi:hypothetical protein